VEFIQIKYPTTGTVLDKTALEIQKLTKVLKMKRTNLNYNGTAVFGSVFNSLFTPVKNVSYTKRERYIPINMRRA